MSIRGVARSGKRGLRPRRQSITAEQFRLLREFTGKSREDVADLVGVSLRTVGHWETGKARPSYAAFRLLRAILRGEVLSEGWERYAFIRGRLVTPEGYSFGPGDLAWLSLLVQRAGYRSLAWAATRQGSCSTGLVPSKTSRTEQGAAQAKSRLSGVVVGPMQGHNGPILAPETAHDRAQAQPAFAHAPDRSGPRRSRGGACVTEHVHPAGGASPCDMDGQPSGEANRQGIAGVAGKRPADTATARHKRTGGARSASDGRARSRRAEGRQQTALSLRKRQALRQVPRAGLTPAGGAA